MKKLSLIIAFTVLMCSFAGCSGGGGAATDVVTTTVQDNSGVKVDVDLTALSGTMVYAEVYNMVNNPQQYTGKTIKVAGKYNASYYDKTDNYYHYVIVADATACCQQGLEFVWSGEHKYPQDYPQDAAQIELIGTYGSYTEQGTTYHCLFVENVKTL
ncbi:MAG: hypothetical protein GX051_07120 [Clostridiales bacterium]|jgi:hypothetical protein|nr:hypothetical protein [Clostridiales bacterium]